MIRGHYGAIDLRNASDDITDPGHEGTAGDLSQVFQRDPFRSTPRRHNRKNSQPFNHRLLTSQTRESEKHCREMDEVRHGQSSILSDSMFGGHSDKPGSAASRCRFVIFSVADNDNLASFYAFGGQNCTQILQFRVRCTVHPIDERKHPPRP